MSTPPPLRVWESHFALYRTIWRSNVLGSFVQPLLYLLGMGVAVGALVDAATRARRRLLGGVDLLRSSSRPALLATTAMMVVAQEALWPVMGGFVWTTPSTPGGDAAAPGRDRRRRRAVARHAGR